MAGLSFNAIDFETANHRRDSACQLGVVQVRDAEIVDRRVWLIRPQPLHFLESHIAIHGITPLEVAGAPTFCEIWDELEPFFQGHVLVAHNAMFDLGVLRACLFSAGLRLPQQSFACSVALGRRAWPGYTSYALKSLASRLGIQFRHHDALEDAAACAHIAIAAAKTWNLNSWEDVATKLDITLGTSGPYGLRLPARHGHRADSRMPSAHRRSNSRNTHLPSRIASHDVQSMWEAGAKAKPLQGERLVFTGRLTAMEREEAERFAGDLGAEVQPRVTAATSLVVLGSTDPRTIRAGAVKSQKQRRAESLRNAGCRIQLLQESEFVEFVNQRLKSHAPGTPMDISCSPLNPSRSGRVSWANHQDENDRHEGNQAKDAKDQVQLHSEIL